ncbi:myotubularin-related protein 1, putative [Ichthyophthirius multifiliis]|uniref:Myotubularin-related protein 1, putative n=1 Tax=Ichthyophthirius multifiliis TaxID=5932 RepID=G0QJL0_ICHMU|nr:myotubularin-related protein 1, putative [Ichthyophthirius multifiliis]EGR34591.1 myotubularin-related protein 1, putative [Ichthyophthirius multifiliis]|eukprot:XP_004039895.1 myotubularin-related protein 1, putative [Ichthyophthirius multifiliis]
MIFGKKLIKVNGFYILVLLLKDQREISESLYNDDHVVVHCSDGWDRTIQLLCISQLLLEPYYRTIEGFISLIEKEWIGFGHQFVLRYGHGSKNHQDENRSPIFIQFLDCVHQLLKQYPLSFQFNQRLLTDLAYHLFSCLYGNFLNNCYQEQLYNSTNEKTLSFWGIVIEQREIYENPFYQDDKNNCLLYLQPNSSLKALRFWKEYFLQYQLGLEDQYKLFEDCKFSEQLYFIIIIY